jgi:hypothetical protein
MKSAIRTLNLHRLTSNSSSTRNFQRLSATRNWLSGSIDCLQDNSSARTPRKTPPSFVKNACLELRCLAIYVLLLRAFAWRGPHRKEFPVYCCHFLKGCIYRSWRRNGCSSIVTCIHCRENVYGHSAIVIEMAHMSQYKKYNSFFYTFVNFIIICLTVLNIQTHP